MDDHGRIRVDEQYKTTAPGIYAAGDVIGPALASIAMEQGRVAVCNAFGVELKGAVDPMSVSAVYSMPEVAGAGLTEEQCRSQGLDYEVGRSDLSLIPRGVIAGHGGGVIAGHGGGVIAGQGSFYFDNPYYVIVAVYQVEKNAWTWITRVNSLPSCRSVNVKRKDN